MWGRVEETEGRPSEYQDYFTVFSLLIPNLTSRKGIKNTGSTSDQTEHEGMFEKNFNKALMDIHC